MKALNFSNLQFLSFWGGGGEGTEERRGGRGDENS